MTILTISQGSFLRTDNVNVIRKMMMESVFGSALPVGEEDIEIRLPQGGFISQSNMVVKKSNDSNKTITVSITSDTIDIVHMLRVEGKVNKEVLSKDKGYGLLVTVNNFFKLKGVHLAIKKNTKGFLVLDTNNNKAINYLDLEDKQVVTLLSLLFTLVPYDVGHMILLIEENQLDSHQLAIEFLNRVVKVPVILLNE